MLFNSLKGGVSYSGEIQHHDKYQIRAVDKFHIFFSKQNEQLALRKKIFAEFDKKKCGIARPTYKSGGC